MGLTGWRLSVSAAGSLVSSKPGDSESVTEMLPIGRVCSLCLRWVSVVLVVMMRLFSLAEQDDGGVHQTFEGRDFHHGKCWDSPYVTTTPSSNSMDFRHVDLARNITIEEKP